MLTKDGLDRSFRPDTRPKIKFSSLNGGRSERSVWLPGNIWRSRCWRISLPQEDVGDADVDLRLRLRGTFQPGPHTGGRQPRAVFAGAKYPDTSRLRRWVPCLASGRLT